jgi:ribosomal protein S21
VVKSFLPYLRLRKIQSILGLAFYQHDEFAGLIGFEFAEKNFVLKEEDAPLLSLFSKILGGEMEQLRSELERREYYEKPSIKKRRKAAEALRKLRKFNRMRRQY